MNRTFQRLIPVRVFNEGAPPLRQNGISRVWKAFSDNPFWLPRAIYSRKGYIIPGSASLLLFFSACYHPQGGPPGGMQGMHGGVPVEILTVRQDRIEQTQEYQGSLISRHSVMLQPQVDGQVAKIYVRSGDRVPAGAPLLLLDPRRQEASLASARADAAALFANISQARSNVASLQEQRKGLQSAVQFNLQQYNRYLSLWNQHAASRQTVEQFSDALSRARADLSANTAQIRSQRSAVVTAQKTYQRAVAGITEQSVQLRYYRITAPFSGMVGDIPVKLGSYVTSDTQLLGITDNRVLELNVGLPSERAFEIRTGLPIKILDPEGRPVAGAPVWFVSPTVSPDTQTILVKANIPNPDGRLKADQSVRVRVTYAVKPGFIVPTATVVHMAGQDFVFLVEKRNGQTFARQLPVTLGDLRDDGYVVRQGLKAGDMIVAQGVQKLMDGVPVTPVSTSVPAKGK